MQIHSLHEAMTVAQQLNSADIIAGLPEAERSQGERIRSAVEKARLAAMNHVLQRAQ
jgi:tRNA nucleotidyltransferase (CCA-adding enzyme)